MPNLKKFSTGVPEISCSWKWDGRTDGQSEKHNTSSRGCCWCGGIKVNDLLEVVEGQIYRVVDCETKGTAENKNRSKQMQKKRRHRQGRKAHLTNVKEGCRGEEKTREKQRGEGRPPERSLLLLIIYPLKTSRRL